MDIAEYNVERLLIRLETMQDFHFPTERDRFLKYDKMWKGEEVKVEEVPEESNIDVMNAQDLLPAFRKFNVKIHFITEPIQSLHKRRKYHNKFDALLLGLTSVHAISSDINSLLKPNASITVETLK